MERTPKTLPAARRTVAPASYRLDHAALMAARGFAAGNLDAGAPLGHAFTGMTRQGLACFKPVAVRVEVA